MEKEITPPADFSENLALAVKVLYESVKNRKIQEFVEEIKNEKQNGEHKRI